MNKTLLFALIGGGLAVAPAMHAEKHYIPVTSVHQLVDGANYAVGAVGNNSNWATSPLFYTKVDDGVTVSGRITENVAEGAFDVSQVWTFAAHDFVCSNTNAGHVAGAVFSLNNGGYIVQSVLVSGNYIPRNGTSKLNVSDEADATTESEFVAVATPDGYAGTGALFAMHTGRNANNTFYNGYRAIKYDGAFDRYSQVSDSYFNMSMSDYTTYFCVYLEIDSENPDVAAAALWHEKVMTSGVVEWAANTSEAFAASMKAMPLPEGIEWDTSLDDEGNPAAMLAQIESAFPDAFDKAVVDYMTTYNGQFTFKNASTGNYLTLGSGTNQPFEGAASVTDNAMWDAVNNDGNLSFKLHGQEIYIGVLPASGNVPRATALAQAGKYHFEFPAATALASSAAVYVRSLDGVAPANVQWHCNTAALQGYSGAGGLSQWIIGEVDASAMLSAAQANLDVIKARVSAMGTSGLNGLWTADEISALSSALDAISFAHDENISYVDATALIGSVNAQVSALLNSFWSKVNGKPMAIEFNRSHNFVKRVGTAAPTSAGTIDVNSLWVMNHQGDMTFTLSHLVSGALMVGNGSAPAMADAESATSANWTVVTCTKNGYAGYPVLACVDRAANPAFHQTTNTVNLMWYTVGDEGSALVVSVASEDLIAAIQNHSDAKNAVEAYLTDGKVSEVRDLGKFSMEGYNAAIGAFENLTADQVSAENIAATFETLTALPAQIEAHLYMPQSGDLIRATASAQNPAHGVATLHYNTEKIADGTTTFISANAETATDENSVFLFADNKLLALSTGMYVKHDNSNRIDFCTSADANSGVNAKFVKGHQETDAYQIVLGTNTNLHIYQPDHATRALGIDRCSATDTKAELHHNWNLELVKTLTVTINQDGFGAFVAPVAVTFPQEDGLTVYTKQILNKNTKESKFMEVRAGAAVSAGVPVLLHGTPNATYTVNVVYPTAEEAAGVSALSDTDAAEENDPALITVHGTHVAQLCAPAEGKAVYALSSTVASDAKDSEEEIHFDKVEAGEQMPIGTMLLTVATDHQIVKEDGAKAVIGLTDTFTTGVKAIELHNLDGTVVIYDLQGRRLSAPAKGVNIINGKKVLVK